MNIGKPLSSHLNTKKILTILVFILFFSLVFNAYTTSKRVAGSEHEGPSEPEISIFDLDPGAQESSSAIDIFSAFLVGGVTDWESLYLAYPSSYGGVAGAKITLTGGGFSSTGNTVYFGSYAIKNINSPTGTTLVFTVPDVLSGYYDIFVSNGENTTGSINFIVHDPENAPPTIDFITPTSGVGRTEVTIHGSGFSTTTGNTILKGYETLENVISPDGITLNISMLPPNFGGDFSVAGAEIVEIIKNLEERKSTGEVQELITDIPEEMWIYVANKNGFSNPVVYTYYYDKTSF